MEPQMTSTAVGNPFELLMNPQAVFKAIESSERLARLQSRICRPLDRPLIPTTADHPAADFDAAIEHAAERQQQG
jgi:hypothetical protein